jgi:tRNA (adenine57-N1/adenine58-N1)-methyltransferase
VRSALKAGGFFGSILPTTNQVTRLLDALRSHDFAFTEVCEIMLRFFRPEPSRFRPSDRMVAHTGFLIFSRPVIIDRSQKQVDETLLEAIDPEGGEEV